MKIILTGAAGFIGYHTSVNLLNSGHEVIGIDNLNNYYDVELKNDRLSKLKDYDNFHFIRNNVESENLYNDAMNDAECIVHLAAQAGVRYSLVDPLRYVQSNVAGQVGILELAKKIQSIKHVVYASSSSVYGNSRKVPFTESDECNNPVSVYAATKKAAEVITQSYCNLYALPCTGVRFFTVYGEFGRPDMSPWIFTKAILENSPIELFGDGKQKRDFTYVEDIVNGVVASINVVPEGKVPHRIINLGNNKPVKVNDLIMIIENITGNKAKIINKGFQPGDVAETYADIELARSLLGFQPSTSLETGMDKFINWYKTYFKI